MSAPPYPLLVVDVDGTLVDGDQRVVAANAEALRRYRAGGGRVMLATGRTDRSVARYRDELALDGPAILYNGASVVDLATGRVLRQWPLGLDADDAVGIAAAATVPVTAMVYGDGRVVAVSEMTPEATSIVDDYAAKDGVVVETWSGRGDDPSPILKVLFVVGGADAADELEAQARATVPGVAVIRTEPNYVELVAAGVSKGAALSWLRAHTDLAAGDVVAVGDQPNDRELLEVATVGVAVGDGHPDLRRIADVVVGPCAAGAVADAVTIALGGQ